MNEDSMDFGLHCFLCKTYKYASCLLYVLAPSHPTMCVTQFSLILYQRDQPQFSQLIQQSPGIPAWLHILRVDIAGEV